MKNLRAYVVTLLAILVLDGIWLTAVGGPLFNRELGSLMRQSPNYIAAGAFYIIYAAGVTVLAVLPPSDNPWRAASRGAVLGCAAYSTFDLTNLAIVAGWSPLVSLVDIAWGTAVTAAAAGIGWWSGARHSRIVGGSQ